MSLSRIPLEVLRIDNRCPADWAAMAGDDKVRFCDGCRKHVHFLSAMTRDEAERLVCASAGNLCVRMVRDRDGTVVTVDYQPVVGQPGRRGWRFWTGIGLLGAMVAGMAQAAGLWRSQAMPMGQTCVAGGIRAWPIYPATLPATAPAATNPAAQAPADPSTTPAAEAEGVPGASDGDAAARSEPPGVDAEGARNQ
jgi:hypothetical protein